jgi:hypothetical protein
MALDCSKLSKAMNEAAYAGDYVNHLMHPGMPKPWTNPMYMTMMNKISDAWKVISAEVCTIENKKEIEKCQAVIDNFKSLQGTYRDLGHQVQVSLDDRIKFLEAHGSL